MMTSQGCQSTLPSSDKKEVAPAKAAPTQKHSTPKQTSRAGGNEDFTLLLEEVELHLASGDPYLALVLLRSVDTRIANESSVSRTAALRIETSIALGLVSNELDWLASPDINPAEAARLRAQICDFRGESACVFTQLNLVAAASDQPEQLNDRIWRALVAAAQTDAPSATPSDELTAGWLALLNIVKRTDSLEAERSAWQAWKLSRPAHPAARVLPDALKYLEHQSATNISQVAVLLPLSGQLQPIGRAVRDGLISAYVHELASSTAINRLPKLRFYDSASTPIQDLNKLALEEGADAIVGPILRDDVLALKTLTPPVPVIALNYIDSAGTDATTSTAPAKSFFQMGIAIEDEARDIAKLLNQKGYEKLLFVVSSAAWADRALNQIQKAWTQKPLILRVRSAGELTGLVGGALTSTPEFVRKSRVQSVTGLAAVISPGKRHDVDGIVALTDPVQTSSLGPALIYHSFGRIDTYMGTQSFRSANDVAGLGNVTVSDLPVMFAQEGFDSTLRRSWLGQSAADISFFALGADAYRLLMRLPTEHSGSTRTIWGASGLLMLDTDGSVRRSQGFGTFRRGSLQALSRAN